MDGLTDGRTDGRTENRTPISHPATSRCDKNEKNVLFDFQLVFCNLLVFFDAVYGKIIRTGSSISI